MDKTVLIVDDNQEMLLTLKEGLDRFQDAFSVLIAGDGQTALQKLQQHWVSMIVTDLKMPRVSGLDLLTHVKQNYPEIPVIIITGYSSPALEEKLRRGGVAQIVEKPFQIKTLADIIKQELVRHFDGGALHNVSPGMFIQLVEMEQKTCTIRIEGQKEEEEGVLFFRQGELMDARSCSHRGVEAAYEIFAWDKVDLVIENTCGIEKRVIEGDLQSVLLEALRRKDEENYDHPAPTPSSEDSQTRASRDQQVSVEGIWKKLKKNGNARYLEGIFSDDSWNALIADLTKIGDNARAGSLKLAYIGQATQESCFLIPQESPIIITAQAKCPRDQIMRCLSS